MGPGHASEYASIASMLAESAALSSLPSLVFVALFASEPVWAAMIIRVISQLQESSLRFNIPLPYLIMTIFTTDCLPVIDHGPRQFGQR